MSNKTIWFEVGQDETISECLKRMKDDGYEAVGRKEEPVFEEIQGNPVPVKQIIKFKGRKIED